MKSLRRSRERVPAPRPVVDSVLSRALGAPLGTAERVSAVCQLLSSAEYLVRRADRAKGGLNDWSLARDQVPSRLQLTRRMRDLVATEAVTSGLHVAQVGAGLVLLSPVRHQGVRAGADLLLAGSQLLLYPRHLYGTDGSDQVSFLVAAAAGLGRAGGTAGTRRAAIEFIGAQTILSYSAAGITKMPGALWKSGDALVSIMRTQTYGDEGFYRLLTRFPRSARALCRGVVAFEALFPLLAVGRGRYMDWGLAVMAAFHAANARFMGLSRFSWAFVSTYPAVRSLVRREEVSA